jgi:hypothetical protein
VNINLIHGFATRALVVHLGSFKICKSNEEKFPECSADTGSEPCIE